MVWLVQIKDAGHAVMSQYPNKINKILQTFPLTTTSHSWDIQSFTRGYVCRIYNESNVVTKTFYEITHIGNEVLISSGLLSFDEII